MKKNQILGNATRSASWILLVLALSVSAQAVSAQETVTRGPAPKAVGLATGGSPPAVASSARKGNLFLRCDAPCRIAVNGALVAELAANEARVIRVSPGQQVVVATSQADSGARLERTVDIRAGGRGAVVLEIADAELEARDARAAGLAATRGYWIDPENRLSWATEDNHRDVTWEGAGQICKDSRLGGFTDWRLPTIEELQPLYDRDVSSEFTIKEPLHLSACCPWSSTRDGSSLAWYYNFYGGRRRLDHVAHFNSARALCVRTLVR